MQTVLFHETIFGPIHSRRLGVSLGVNLMPNDGKICSFDCLYCEAGFNAQGQGTTGVPTRDQVKRALRKRLAEMQQAGDPLDVIVTGLTAATTALMWACACYGVPLTLWHFDRETGEYRSQRFYF